jgi:hypothetical protein
MGVKAVLQCSNGCATLCLYGLCCNCCSSDRHPVQSAGAPPSGANAVGCHIRSLRSPRLEPWGACHFIVNARTESTQGFRASVGIRYLAALCFVALAALQLTRWNIVVFSVPDFLGATWTALALRADSLAKKPVAVAS